MISLLKTYRKNLFLILCIYSVSVFAQPWLHTHKDTHHTVNQPHAHFNQECHHHEHDQNHKDNTHQAEVCSDQVAVKAPSKPCQQPVASHLLLDSSVYIAYTASNLKIDNVSIFLPFKTVELSLKDIKPISADSPSEYKYPKFINSSYITSLTDLSPPVA